MICGYCGHMQGLLGAKHYPECAFNPNYIPMKPKVPPCIIDPFLGDKESRKRLEEEFKQGRWRKLSDGCLEKVEIAWPRI